VKLNNIKYLFDNHPDSEELIEIVQDLMSSVIKEYGFICKQQMKGYLKLFKGLAFVIQSNRGEGVYGYKDRR